MKHETISARWLLNLSSACNHLVDENHWEDHTLLVRDIASKSVMTCNYGSTMATSTLIGNIYEAKLTSAT